MTMRNSLAAAIAAAITAMFLSIAIQPAKAATYTWRTGASGTGNVANYSNPTNWVGGVAAVSSTSTTLQFNSNTTSGSMTTTPGAGGFSLSQLLVGGTTTYRQGSFLNFASGGSIVNTSSVLQELLNVKPNGAGFSVTSTSGTLALTMNYATPGPVVTLAGSGVKELNGNLGNIGAGIVVNGGPVVVTNSANAYPNIVGDLTINAGSFTYLGPNFITVNTFTAASGVPVFLQPNGSNPGLNAGADVNYGGMALNVDLTNFTDVTTGYTPGDFVQLFFGSGGSFNGNLGSLASTASSGPYAGLTWSADGSNWVSSQFNGIQQLEFRPADGGVYFVPEPSQMVLVAGAGMALGAMRLRRLRRGRTAASEALAG